MTTMLLWCGAVGSLVIVLTQPAERTWLADAWVAASWVLAIGASVVRASNRKRQRRMEAGHHD